MSEILELSDEEQLEVYRAVVALVKERIERAKSVKKSNKKSKPDVEVLASAILNSVNFDKLKKFPDDYLKSKLVDYYIVETPSGIPRLSSSVWGKWYVEVENQRLEFNSRCEAQYVYYALLNGNNKIKIPKDKDLLKEIVEDYGTLFKQIKEEIMEKTDNQIPDRKLREQVKRMLERKLVEKLAKK
ncbi:MAG: hypothetical protein GSR79_06320 [Desulfurococcales archaeon]|nr:hypothetical protein [Desulfurococcales archaeon]